MSQAPLLTLDQQWLLAKLEAMLPDLQRNNPAAPAAFHGLVRHFAKPDPNPGQRAWQLILRLQQEFERGERYQDPYTDSLSSELRLDISELQESLFRRAIRDWTINHPMVQVNVNWVMEELVSHFGNAWFNHDAIPRILDATYLFRASDDSLRQLHRRAQFLLKNAHLAGQESCVTKRTLVFTCVLHTHYRSPYLSSTTEKALTAFLHWLDCILDGRDPLVPYVHPELESLHGEPLFERDRVFSRCTLRFHKNKTCKAIFSNEQLAQHVAERLCEPSQESSITLVIPTDTLPS